jgi:hypothetical protein
LLLSGCGGAAASGSGEGSSDGDKPGGSSVPADEEAEQAQAFCEHAVAKSINQPPDALSRKQIMACLTAVRPALNKDCSKGIGREVVLKLVIDKSGDVIDAFPVGDAADSPQAGCVAEIVKQVKFPMFKGSSQQVIEKYPFKLGE